MKISQLIERLQYELEKLGDIEVLIEMEMGLGEPTDEYREPRMASISDFGISHIPPKPDTLVIAEDMCKE